VTRRSAWLAALLGVLLAAAPATASPNVRTSQASCEKRVTFALVDARTSGCLTKASDNPATWESTDEVNVDGIPLKALPGTRLVLKAPTSGAPGGSIAVATKITLGGVTVFDGGFDYNLPAGAPGEVKTLATISPPAGAKIKGLSIGGSASIQIGRDKTGEQQGFSRFELIVKLPDVFRGGPDKKDSGLTGTVAIRADASGVHADALKIELANAYVGQVLLKNACLSYVSATSPTTPCSPPKFGATQLLECKTTGADRWDGSARIQLPTADKPEIGVFAGTANGQFAYAGAQVTHLGKAAPLAPGVYLDKVGIAICLNPAPMKIKGSIGIRFGPDFNGSQAAYLEGSVQYTDSRPWVLEANGKLKLFDKEVAKGYFTYRSDGAIDFGFDVSWSFYGVLDVQAGLSGWYQPSGIYTTDELDLSDAVNRRRFDDFHSCLRNPACIFNPVRTSAVTREYTMIPHIQVPHPRPAKFDVFGHGRVCAVSLLCVGGEVAVSSVGVAGCVEFTVFGYPEFYFWGARWHEVKVRGGAGYRWGGGGVDVMGGSCDVGPYRAQKSAVAAGGGRTIRLRREPAVALRITGRGAAPKVLIVGPGGRRIVADRAGRLERDRYYYVEDAPAETASIMISEPAPGRWTVRPLPGSAPVVAVSAAPVYPEPEVKARVIGHGSQLALEYGVETSPGLAVTFWERGADYEQELGPAHGVPCLQNAPIQGHRPRNAFMTHPHIICGALPFGPAPGPGGERRIVAVISNHGEPVSELQVASYETRAEALPARPPHVRIVRRAGTVRITWGRAQGAAGYDVDVRLSDGARLLEAQGPDARRVVLRDIPRSVGARVSVRGVRTDNVQGPAAIARSPGR
jgi:hypothetical protein